MPPRVVNKQRVRLHRRRRLAACHIVSSRGLEMTPRKCPTWIKKEWHGGNFDPPPSEHRVCIEERKLSRRRRAPAGRKSNIYEWPWIETVSAQRIKKEPWRTTKGNLLEHPLPLPPRNSGQAEADHPSFLSPLPPSLARYGSPLPKLARLIFIGGDFFLLSLPLSHTHS